MLSSLLAATVLVVNELMASNAGTVMSPATNFDSWIELYNPSDQAVSLAGMYLSDREDMPLKWKMPVNMGSVAAKGYKVVWLGSYDIKDDQAFFKLDCDGGVILLSDQNGKLVCKQEYPEAMSRTAWARKTDGGDAWGWTATPTPGATNNNAVYCDKRLEAPVVSEGSRLFQQSFTVQVDIPAGTTLKYTIDGSMPTASNGRRATNGKFTVSKTTNYVFRLFKDGYLPSVPVTRSYIQSSSYTCPVVSIVGDERYFTDAMWGIDTEGRNGQPGNGRDDAVNWNMDWDRPVNFSYISPTEGMLFNQDVNISVSGGWTRNITPRSMKLKGNKIFDGQNHLNYAFFAQKPYIRNKAVLVRNGGNDVWQSHARFMDAALETIILRSGIDLDAQSTVQVAEYINGRFKGILNLRETNNDKFVDANYGYDDEEIDMFENNEFKNGTDEAYNRLCQLATRATEDAIYEEIKALLDVDNFAYYMAVELFVGNDDWPQNNVKAYRSRPDGRYRFISFDLDYAFNPWGGTIATLDSHKNIPMVSMFLNLLKRDEFRKKFIDAICIVGGSVFECERATTIVDELANSMRPMSQLDGYVPDRAANTIKEQLKTRSDVITSRLQQYQPMKLSGVKRQKVVIDTDTEAANLYINGQEVPYASFNGHLFGPVTLEAKAPTGYTFAGWKRNASASRQLIKMNDTWKYYDKGEAPATWYAGSFSDSGWASGQAPLGYSMTGVKTTVSYGSDANYKNPTTYFRKTISLSSTPKRSDIFLLNYAVDDGFVVYVNGKEAGRFNMPSGNITFNSFASSYASDTPLTGTIDLSSSLFKSGSNVIAVEIHNNKYASSDQYWAAELLTSMGTSTGSYVSTDAVLKMPDDAGLSLVACFTPLSDKERADQGIPAVCINEVSAANGIYVNEYFKRNDWVELHNTTDKPYDVEGMYLSNDLKKREKYRITKGTTTASTVIPAHGYLIVWCDKLEPQSQLHASFKLAAEGGDVVLMAADSSWGDILNYPEHAEDQTVGRYPDGSRNVYVMNVPTIARANVTSSYVTEVEQQSTTGIIERREESEERREERGQIYNLKGQAVKRPLAPGIYIMNGRKFIIK